MEGLKLVQGLKETKGAKGLPNRHFDRDNDVRWSELEALVAFQVTTGGSHEPPPGIGAPLMLVGRR
jgi:hypothetical protein